MKIRTDVSYHKILRQIQKSQDSVMEKFEKMSSGKRITKASDDVAGLQVSNRLTRQTIGNKKSNENIQMAIDLLKVGDGGMKEIQHILQRMKELATQAANGVYKNDDRVSLNREFNELSKAINKIANNTTYNEIHVLNRSLVHSGVVGSGGSGFGNLFAEPYVASNGNFKFVTEEGYSTTPLDNNMRLVYNGHTATGSTTSHPAVRINGNTYNLPIHLLTNTVVSGNDYVTKYRILGENVDVMQTVRLVEDKFEIRYKIDNWSGVAKNIGFLFHIDTQIGTDDHAPFIVDGNHILTSGPEQEYTGASIPSEFFVYNTTVNPDIQAHAVITGTGIIETPDKLGIGTYSDTRSWTWTPDGSIGDSSYALWWNERNVNDGGSFEVNTFYGMSVPPTVEAPTDSENDGMVRVHHSMEDEARVLLSMADMRSSTLGIDTLHLLDQNNARNAMSGIDDAITKVSQEQTRFGSYINRMYVMKDYTTTKVETSTVSNQRIEDADVAKTTSELSANNVKLNVNLQLLQKTQDKYMGLVQVLQN